MIFPLRLSAFEEYMLGDDRSAYPMNCFVRLKFNGLLDRERFEMALQTAANRHALLSSVVRTSGRRQFHWVPTKNKAPEVRWLEHPNPSDFPTATHLNVQHQTGLVCHVISNVDSFHFIMQFHHSCCDAAGGFQFLEDLLMVYANSVEPPSRRLPLPMIDQQKLPLRNSFGLTLSRCLKLIPSQMLGILGARKFLMRKPVPLVPHQLTTTDSGPGSNYPAVLSFQFNQAETASILATAHRQAVTVNDLLARDLFLALEDFRLRQRIGKETDWLRLTIPMNLRADWAQNLPAANAVSMVFLDRQRSDCDDPMRLLHGIQEEMDLIKRHQLGFTFLLSLKTRRSLPGGLASAMQKNCECMATSVLTNLGRPFANSLLPRQDGKIVAGDIVLEAVEGVVPLRPHTCAGFALTTYADQLNIVLHYDLRVLTQNQAEDLLNTYVGFVRNAI